MTGDFPDRDEWTDRLLSGPPRGECDACGKQGHLAKVIAFGIETYACSRCRNRDEYDEAAEWDALGDTDLISTEELADVVRPTIEDKT